jgi:hypothetical protein
MTGTWQMWALLSAVFAALTAIFAKVGVENVSSDLATFIRTLVVVVALGALLVAFGEFRSLPSVSPRTWLFLVLSGLATGASWLCFSAPSRSGKRRGWRRSTSSAWCSSPCSARLSSAKGLASSTGWGFCSSAAAPFSSPTGPEMRQRRRAALRP